MGDLVTGLVQAPVGNVLVVAGLGFIALSILGRLKDWFALSKTGRYVAGTAGVLLVAVGSGLYREQWKDGDSVTDIAIVVTAATASQPTSTGRFHIDSKYMGT